MRRSKEYYADLFARLGERLEGFGTTYPTRAVAEAAVAANPWFTLSDVRFAVDALRRSMLDAEVLKEWLARYETVGRPCGRRVAVIMAGNIPLVGFADLLYVVASGNIPFVKPSSKDSVLMAYVVGLLRELAPGVPVEQYVPGGRYDAAIATGSDNTGRYFHALFDGIPSLIRGSRGSVALLTGDETEDELRSLGRDMFRYSGLGCRNVGLVFVPQACDLDRFARTVAPAREEVNPKYYNNYRSLRAQLRASGAPFCDGGTFVMTEGEQFPVALSNIVAYRYGRVEEAYAWLKEHDGKVQCVVGRDALHPRAVGFGEGQTPRPWDYPDGRDVMEFLASVSPAETDHGTTEL